MEKFEYYTWVFKVCDISGGKLDVHDFMNGLNKLGAEGWELINSVPSNEGFGHTRKTVYIFKRKITKDD